MTSTILVAGATGNIGRGVVATLSKLLSTSSPLPAPQYRVIALTRSRDSPAAQHLAELPGVEVIEQNWVDITAGWLRNHGVTRAFIASHNNPNQFAEESTFHLAALVADLEYVVRISTTAANVRPDCAAYYPRTHWAIEALLSSPAFQRLQWTSLQPNIFTTMYLANAAEFVKHCHKTGKQGTLSIMASRDAPVGVIDPEDIGVLAASLLLVQEPAIHNQARYVLNGPEDVTGLQIVEMVEQCIGTKVEDVRYKDMSFVHDMAATSTESKSLILSIEHAPETAWQGHCTASTTSQEISDLFKPKYTPADVLKRLLGHC